MGFPNSLYRDVIKDPKNFQGLGSLGFLNPSPFDFRGGADGVSPWVTVAPGCALAFELGEQRALLKMSQAIQDVGFRFQALGLGSRANGPRCVT